MSGVEGENSWEISASEGWTGRNRRETTLEFISDAKINKGARPLIKDLSARRLRITNRKDITVLKKADESNDGKQYLARADRF